MLLQHTSLHHSSCTHADKKGKLWRYASKQRQAHQIYGYVARCRNSAQRHSNAQTTYEQMQQRRHLQHKVLVTARHCCHTVELTSLPLRRASSASVIARRKTDKRHPPLHGCNLLNCHQQDNGPSCKCSSSLVLPQQPQQDLQDLNWL